MREALRQLAVAAVPAVSGRVFDANGALPGTPTPYLVMVVGPETVETDWLAPAWPVTFWATIDRVNPFTSLDALTGALITGLDDKKIVDGADSYLVQYAGSTAQDQVDEDRDLISRAVRFTVEGLEYASSATDSPDPVAALAAATTLAFPTLTVAANLEPTTDPAPAVYFRIAAEERVEAMVGGLGAWHDATIAGHVQAPGPVSAHRWARRLAEWLSRRVELTLDDGSPMQVRGVSLDLGASARVQGQLRIQVRFGTLTGAAPDLPADPDAPPIEHVFGRDPDGVLSPKTPTELVAQP